jgi:hypothetical protein
MLDEEDRVKTNTYKILSQSCFTAGSLSIVGSLGLWMMGRMTRNKQMQHDGLFVGLWVPSFFVLADRLATAALDHQEKARSVNAGTEALELCEEELEALEQCGPVQSPRPLSHVSH